MKLRLLTLFSIIVALVVKTYTLSARDGVIDDEEAEVLANWELKNREDSVQHEKHVLRIVDVLATSERVTEEFTGAASLVPCEGYREYTKLRTAANEQELNSLLLHKSPVIRVYAHRAMVERNLQPDPEILALMASDSTEVQWLNGDVVVHTTVMDLVTSNMFLPKQDESPFIAVVTAE